MPRNIFGDPLYKSPVCEDWAAEFNKDSSCKDCKGDSVSIPFDEYEHCSCEDSYTIEPHGKFHALYYARCAHRHGMNLMLISEIDARFDISRIAKKLNAKLEDK